jgi:PAS domain S-box-containing protein
MIMPDINYHAVFRSFPGPTALLSREFTILDVNDDYLAAVGRERQEVEGRNIFAAFPPNPRAPGGQSQRRLLSSLEAVLATGERDTMELMRYDVEVPGQHGVFDERYWAVVNTPVLGSDGTVELIENRAEDATFIVRQVLKTQAVSG